MCSYEQKIYAKITIYLIMLQIAKYFAKIFRMQNFLQNTISQVYLLGTHLSDKQYNQNTFIHNYYLNIFRSLKTVFFITAELTVRMGLMLMRMLAYRPRFP